VRRLRRVIPYFLLLLLGVLTLGAAAVGHRQSPPARYLAFLSSLSANPYRVVTPKLSHHGTFPTGPQYAYITSFDGIYAVNLSTHQVTQLVASPIVHEAGLAYPSLSFTDLAVTTNGRMAYATTSQGLVRIDLVTGLVSKPLDDSMEWGSIALVPGDRSACVVNVIGSNSQPYEMAFVDLTSWKIRWLHQVPGGGAIAVTPDGRTAYLPTRDGSGIVPIDLESGKAGHAIEMSTSDGGSPVGASSIAIAPDGQTVYATSTMEEAVGRPASGHEVSYVTPVNLATQTAGSPITVYHGPYDIAVAQNGRMAYVTTEGPWLLAVNLATGKAAGTIRLPVASYNVAVP
jgi:DNA-binding beta-propeller fold protein YncE